MDHQYDDRLESCGICEHDDVGLDYIPTANIALCDRCYASYAMLHKYDLSVENLKRTEAGLKMMALWLHANASDTIH